MKKKGRDSYERLKHIRKAISEIETFTGDSGRKEFLNNTVLSSAVLFQFSVIGEAVVHIDPKLLDRYDYPWYKVRSFRNLISHEYFDIKLEAVWDIIVQDLPELKQIIETILEEESGKR